MNPTIGHAATVIRTGLGKSTGDVALTIACDLDAAGLLVEDLDGLNADRPCEPEPQPPVAAAVVPPPSADTVSAFGLMASAVSAQPSLEQQAAAWEEACERARELADRLAADHPGHPALQSVFPDRDRVIVTLEVTRLSDWHAWWADCGIGGGQLHALGNPPYAAVMIGDRNGVPVHLIGYGVPDLHQRAQAAAADPCWWDARLFDLGRPMSDLDGKVWRFATRRPDGVPMVVMDGTSALCTLGNAVRQVGLQPNAGEAPVPAQLSEPSVTDAEDDATDNKAEQPPEDSSATAPDQLAGEETPAAHLAGQLRRLADVTDVEVHGPTALTVHCKPSHLDEWTWFLGQIGVAPERVTYKGPLATASGSRGSVTVALVGYDVPALYLNAAGLHADGATTSLVGGESRG